MPTSFSPVTSITALDRLLDRSRQQPVVLFKHDTTCSISAAAYQELAQLPDDITLVDGAEQNDLAQHIAARTGIAHQSPQVIVFDDGKPIWSASLHDITATRVEQAVHHT